MLLALCAHQHSQVSEQPTRPHPPSNPHAPPPYRTHTPSPYRTHTPPPYRTHTPPPYRTHTPSYLFTEKTNQVYASLSLGPNREIDYELLNHLAAEDKDVTSAANDKDITSAEDMRFDDYDDDFMSPVRCKQSGLDRFLNGYFKFF